MRTTRDLFIISAPSSATAVTAASFFWPGTMALWLVVGPPIIIGWHDLWQRKHTVLRLYPVVDHIRFLFESIRPTGVATQNPYRYQALGIDDKAQRVTRYQQSVIRNLMEPVSAFEWN